MGSPESAVIISCGANVYEHTDRFPELTDLSGKCLVVAIKTATKFLDRCDIMAVLGHPADCGLDKFDSPPEVLETTYPALFRTLAERGVKRFFLFGFFLVETYPEDLRNYTYEDIRQPNYHWYELEKNGSEKKSLSPGRAIEGGNVLEYCEFIKLARKYEMYNISASGCMPPSIPRLDFDSALSAIEGKMQGLTGPLKLGPSIQEIFERTFDFDKYAVAADTAGYAPAHLLFEELIPSGLEKTKDRLRGLTYFILDRFYFETSNSIPRDIVDAYMYYWHGNFNMAWNMCTIEPLFMKHFRSNNVESVLEKLKEQSMPEGTDWIDYGFPSTDGGCGITSTPRSPLFMKTLAYCIRPGVDWEVYRKAYPDFPSTWSPRECAQHYNSFGQYENRRITYIQK